MSTNGTIKLASPSGLKTIDVGGEVSLQVLFELANFQPGDSSRVYVDSHLVEDEFSDQMVAPGQIVAVSGTMKAG